MTVELALGDLAGRRTLAVRPAVERTIAMAVTVAHAANLRAHADLGILTDHLWPPLAFLLGNLGRLLCVSYEVVACASTSFFVHPNKGLQKTREKNKQIIFSQCLLSLNYANQL